MSSHFDLVIICDLREDTPASCIEMIEWLTNPASDPATKPDFDCFDENEKPLNEIWDHPFLTHFDNDDEVVSAFQKQYRGTMPPIAGGGDIYRYALQFSARSVLDDYFYDCHYSFVYWLAAFIDDGFIGYYKEEYEDRPTLLYVKDRKLVELP